MAIQAFARKEKESSEYVEYLYDENYTGDYEGMNGRVQINKNTFEIKILKSICGNNMYERCGALIASKIVKMYREYKVFPERASRES